MMQTCVNIGDGQMIQECDPPQFQQLGFLQSLLTWLRKKILSRKESLSSRDETARCQPGDRACREDQPDSLTPCGVVGEGKPLFEMCWFYMGNAKIAFTPYTPTRFQEKPMWK